MNHDDMPEILAMIGGAMGIDPDALREKIQEAKAEMEKVREKTSRTPLNEEQQVEYLNAMVPVLYPTPRSFYQ